MTKMPWKPRLAHTAPFGQVTRPDSKHRSTTVPELRMADGVRPGSPGCLRAGYFFRDAGYFVSTLGAAKLVQIRYIHPCFDIFGSIKIFRNVELYRLQGLMVQI